MYYVSYHLLQQANHFNTYGGNPLASTVGIAVLDAIEKDQCQKVSQDIGTHLLMELAKLRDHFEVNAIFNFSLNGGGNFHFQSASEMFVEKDP